MDPLKAIVAIKDSSGRVRGTAFYVGSNVAITCRHVIEAAGGEEQARVCTDRSREGHPILEEDHDVDLDISVIRVPKRRKGDWLWLSPAPADAGIEVHTHGFPENATSDYFPSGHPFAYDLLGPVEVNWHSKRRRALALKGKRAQAGMSGAPALDGQHRVIGVLNLTCKEEESTYALPVAELHTRWPSLAMQGEGPGLIYEQLVSEAFPDAIASTRWNSFDSSKFHCVIIDSEGLATAPSEQKLSFVTSELFSSRLGSDLWPEILQAYRNSRLLGETSTRRLPTTFKPRCIKIASFSVLDAFANSRSLDEAIRLIVESDLTVVDVTNFEPGVMLLLGVRAATRRGITIHSHGGAWFEGDPLDRPFNLANLSIGSHSQGAHAIVGEDPRVMRLYDRLKSGFQQLATQVHYQDSPAFDALRDLGAHEGSWATIPIEEEVLILCSYNADYFPTWQAIRKAIKEALAARDCYPKVARLQDFTTPQLVSQALYHRIRRSAGCVADWTLSSPSTFFELGVRLAVSHWDVVQIADERWLRRSGSDGESTPTALRQLTLMQPQLRPLTYSNSEVANLGQRIATGLLESRNLDGHSSENRIRRVVAQAIARVEQQSPEVFRMLNELADSLDHPNRERVNVPQALFYDVRELKDDQEQAAREQRLAAWFYLEHRLNAGERPENDPIRRTWREVGELVASALFLSEADADFQLASRISERVRCSP